MKKLMWDHKRSYTKEYFSNWNKDLFIKAIEQIPQGADCKLTLQWNDPVDLDKETDKVLKKMEKVSKKEVDTNE